MTFKILHGRSPDHLKELVTIKELSRYNIRSNNGLLLNIPSIKSKFKSSLKTYFFNVTYNYDLKYMLYF